MPPDGDGMEVKMKYILSILGSSAFGVLVTLVFNWMQNRRTASLNYITDERKKWREKIRTISAQIERCDFQGKGDLQIEQYLVQLQMNINPYGSIYKGNDCHYYKRDAYIWDAIDGIQNAPNKKLFDKNKELLLRYLSFMLKMDWERSKKEVKNLSAMKIVWILTVVSASLIFLYEYFGLNLGKSMKSSLYFLIDALMICIVFLGVSLYCIFNTSDDKNKKIWSLKKAVFYQTKGKIISFFCLLFAACAILFSSFGFGLAAPDLMVGNMIYYTDVNGEVYLYSGLSEVLFPNFQVKLQKKLGRKVILSENRVHDVEIVDQGIDYDREIYDVLYDTVAVITLAKMLRDSLIAVSIVLLYGVDDIDAGVEFGLKHSKYMIFDEYEKIVRNTLSVIERVTETFGDSNFRKENDELLGLSYEFLLRAEEELSHQICMVESQMENIQQWEMKKQKQQSLDFVKDSIKLLKKYYRRKGRKARLNILVEVKSNLQEMIDISI